MRKVGAFGGLFLLSAACSASAVDDSGSSQALVDESCVCALDQVCTAEGQCIARPVPAAGESFGEVELLHQAAPQQHGALHDIGKASATFHDYEPMPKDDRPKFAVAGGGECAFEVGTNYPSYYNGQSWPTGATLGAGNLSFGVTGSTVAIELNALDLNEYGWGYLHRDAPPALTEPSSQYPDFFDPSVLPSGATFTVRSAGGPQVGETTLSGELPVDFSIQTPPVEASGATASAAKGVRVEWSPPQPSARMEIFVTAGSIHTFMLLGCKIPDTGATVIPAEALGPFVGRNVGIQLRRTTERYSKIATTDGRTLHMTVLGRHARLGSLTLQ